MVMKAKVSVGSFLNAPVYWPTAMSEFPDIFLARMGAVGGADPGTGQVESVWCVTSCSHSCDENLI
jgi:hypothetical protein